MVWSDFLPWFGRSSNESWPPFRKSPFCCLKNVYQARQWRLDRRNAGERDRRQTSLLLDFVQHLFERLDIFETRRFSFGIQHARFLKDVLL